MSDANDLFNDLQEHKKKHEEEKLAMIASFHAVRKLIYEKNAGERMALIETALAGVIDYLLNHCDKETLEKNGVEVDERGAIKWTGK